MKLMSVWAVEYWPVRADAERRQEKHAHEKKPVYRPGEALHRARQEETIHPAWEEVLLPIP